MQVRIKEPMHAERVESEERADRFVVPLGGRQPAVGDVIIHGHHGAFFVDEATFRANYEEVGCEKSLGRIAYEAFSSAGSWASIAPNWDELDRLDEGRRVRHIWEDTANAVERELMVRSVRGSTGIVSGPELECRSLAEALVEQLEENHALADRLRDVIWNTLAKRPRPEPTPLPLPGPPADRSGG